MGKAGVGRQVAVGIRWSPFPLPSPSLCSLPIPHGANTLYYLPPLYLPPEASAPHSHLLLFPSSTPHSLCHLPTTPCQMQLQFHFLPTNHRAHKSVAPALQQCPILWSCATAHWLIMRLSFHVISAPGMNGAGAVSNSKVGEEASRVWRQVDGCCGSDSGHDPSLGLESQPQQLPALSFTLYFNPRQGLHPTPPPPLWNGGNKLILDLSKNCICYIMVSTKYIFNFSD